MTETGVAQSGSFCFGFISLEHLSLFRISDFGFRISG